jgi:glycosyltransferase involved in cell wall biosynthesis
MKFSVIVPAFNPTQLLFHGARTAGSPNSEVLIIDDGSTEWNLNSVAPTHRTDKQRGPGAARNVGLAHAQGDWIVFLDSDDELVPGALDKLSAFIDENPDVDAIGYGWEFAHQQGINQRKDGACLSMPKRDMLKEYLKLRMDGSVIYTAVKRSVIEDNGLRFRDGLHEDIDFIFSVYLRAKKAAYLPEILYRKTQRKGSIVNTMTQAHIDGFFGGWSRIKEFIEMTPPSDLRDEYRDAYRIGTVGVIATRAREVMYRAANASLFGKLADSIPDAWKEIVLHFPFDTLYAKVAEMVVNREPIDPAIFKKSWGCNDLHNSLFLAPNEARACCKRFFVDGEMRGDVVLAYRNVNPSIITKAKRDLLLEINKGEPTPCTGCPFLEFKDWGSVEPLRIQHLSMEHHSVCNMKCTYCDEKYYGAVQPSYDVLGLLRKLYSDGAFGNLRTVIWGGGEPVVGKRFPELVAHLTESTSANHRFLTNALVYSPSIANAIQSGRGTVTTSIDAGTEAKFAEVRGTNLGMHRVLGNLRGYAEINPQAVTVKYILTDDNITHAELKHFKAEIARHELTHCNFQISCDFKRQDAIQQAIAAMQLFAMLREAGCKIVFFDDLLMQRLVVDDDGLRAAEWMRMHYADVRAWPEHYTKVVVWGSGGMTEWTINNTDFFKHVIVADRNKHVPGMFAVITGSQGYADNYRKALAAGVPENMIIKGAIL